MGKNLNHFFFFYWKTFPQSVLKYLERERMNDTYLRRHLIFTLKKLKEHKIKKDKYTHRMKCESWKNQSSNLEYFFF